MRRARLATTIRGVRPREPAVTTYKRNAVTAIAVDYVQDIGP